VSENKRTKKEIQFQWIQFQLHFKPYALKCKKQTGLAFIGITKLDKNEENDRHEKKFWIRAHDFG
jgi:hypothetical protein